MSKALSEEEKRQKQLRKEEMEREQTVDPKLDERCYEILQILRDAPKHPEIKYNSKFFEKYFNTSNITILRAIKKLKEMNILEEKQKNGSYVIKSTFEDYFYSEKTKENIELVASLRGLLQQYKNTPLYDSVTKLIYFLQPEVAKNNSVFSTGRIVVAPQIEYNINTENWNEVYKAINENRIIEFRYTKPYTDTKSFRSVWPLQLILDNGSVYLFAYSEYADLGLLYDLNYMTDIYVTKDKFQLPEKFAINNYTGGGRLGVFNGNKVEKFKIKFTGYAKEWIKNHKWADDQTFKETKDSTTIIFSSSQFERVLQLILSWGQQAKPIAPTRLVKRWKEEIIAMYEMVK